MRFDVFIPGAVLAAFIWFLAARASRRILLAQKPKSLTWLMAQGSLILDIFGMMVVGFLCLIALATAVDVFPHDAGWLFSFSPYVLAVYGGLRLYFRRRTFAALNQALPTAAVPEQDG